MKIFLTSILLFALLLNLHAQEDFAPMGANWIYHMDAPNEQDVFGYESFTVEQDTLIDGLNCKVLSHESFDPFNGNVDRSDEIICHDSTKVIWKNGVEDWVIYDFAAEAGDSWNLVPDSDQMMVVDSTSSIVINGEELKVQHMRLEGSDLNLTFAGPVLQVLGNTQYLFPIFGPEWLGPLRCYEDDFLGYYNTDAYPSCTYDSGFNGTSLDEKEQAQLELEIAPNPSPDYVKLSLPEGWQRSTTQISLLNIFGQVLLEDQSTSISLAHLAQGLYLLRALNDKGESLVKAVSKM